MRPRIILLCLVTLALLATAGWMGVLDLLWKADHVHATPIIGAVVLIGLGFAWFGDWGNVFWVKESLPFLGLILTSYGIIVVGPAVLAGGNDNIIRASLIMALVPNCLAAAGFGWLRLVRRVCEPRHAD